MQNSDTRSAVQAWAAFDDFPDAIAVLGRDLRWLYANPAVEQVLGTASAGMIGKKLGEIGALPAETRRGWQRQCMNVLATGRASSYRLQSSAHEPVRHYCVRIVAQRDDRGRIDGLLNIAGAVTERTEIELLPQSETRGVEEQATFLQREEALRGRAGAVSGQTPGMSRVKDDALARLSHELRTPLNAILGWTQMLQSGADGQTVARALRQIEESARAQARLIDDLLDLSGNISGRMRMMAGDNASSASVPSGLHPAFAQSRSLAGLRILAVDDDRNTRDMLLEALARAGADVRAAGSAREALDKLQRYRPDVLLSDIGMPGQDGCELLHRVRGLPAQTGGATPAIAITGYAREDDRAATRAAGYQAVVTKPVNLDDLINTILDVARPT